MKRVNVRIKSWEDVADELIRNEEYALLTVTAFLYGFGKLLSLVLYVLSFPARVLGYGIAELFKRDII